jgi:hypothetical protein
MVDRLLAYRSRKAKKKPEAKEVIVKPFSRLFSLAEEFLKALQNLESAVRGAAKAEQQRGEFNQQVSAEIRFAEQVEREQNAVQQKQIRIQLLIAVCTAVASIAAAISAGISLWQLQEMRQQTVEANRAWLAPETPIFSREPVIGAPVMIAFPSRNVGHEPALDMKMSVFFDTTPAPKDWNMANLKRVEDGTCSAHPPSDYLGVIFPVPDHDAVIEIPSSQNGVVWSQDLDNNKVVLRVRGCISYRSFGVLRLSWFCYAFAPGPTVPGSVNKRIGGSCHSGEGAN